MAGRVEGKVALVTGAARGQGRSHALRLAEEGADIVAIDMCADIPTNGYPLATREDLQETAKQIEGLGRRVVTDHVDVRERSAVASAVSAGVGELGHLDIVVANAGIAPLGADVPYQGFIDAVQVDFAGVLNTVEGAIPHLQAGASIVATGSVAAMLQASVDTEAAGPGGAGYGWAKNSVGEFIHTLALQLAPHSIRANAVHPGNCNTDMLHSTPMYRMFRPDLDNPTREDADGAFYAMQAMPVPYIEPADVSNAVLFLASDEARYVTGLQLKVDAGALLRQSMPK